MDFITIFFVLAVACVISFIAMHLWVFLCDCVLGFFKRILGLQKKQKPINWHTANEQTTQKKQEDITKNHTSVNENEKLL